MDKPPPVKPSEKDYPTVAPPAFEAGVEPTAPDAPPPSVAPRVESMQAAARKGRQFHCPTCGSEMPFTPTAQTLKCTHCGFEKHVPQTMGDVREIPFSEFVDLAKVPQKILSGAEVERRCDGCGAMVMFSATTATDDCPFCGAHLDNPVETAQPMIEPGGVLPFAIPEPDARLRFKKWVSSRWLAPGSFYRMAELNKVRGLYVPFWTYDATSWSFYTGQRGDAYWVTVGHGKNRRRERRIRWTTVSGRLDHWFDDVLVCGSHSLPEKLVRNLEPWDLVSIQPYAPSFLSGFRSERYQVGADEGFVLARLEMDNVIRQLICRQIGGDEQRISSVQTQVDNVTFKYILLPVWLAAYRYNDKTFRVLINARTGEVQGQRPWSTAKIATLIALGVIVILIIVAIIASKS